MVFKVIHQKIFDVLHRAESHTEPNETLDIQKNIIWSYGAGFVCNKSFQLFSMFPVSNLEDFSACILDHF